MPTRPVKLVDHGFAAEAAILTAREDAHTVVAHRAKTDMRLGNPLSDLGILGGPIVAGNPDNLIELGLKQHLLT